MQEGVSIEMQSGSTLDQNRIANDDTFFVYCRCTMLLVVILVTPS